MRLLLSSIALRPGTGPAQALLSEYVARLAAYLPAETQLHRSEPAFLDSLARHRGRTAPLIVLLDRRGKQYSSETLATLLGAERDGGRQLILFAIGPPDGWSDAALALAQSGALLLSFGPITLPHELARVVLAEQLYRACTILAGHPYHGGHTTA